MKSIPKEKFKPLIGTDRQIAFKDTNLRNFSGNMKLIVVRFFEEIIEFPALVKTKGDKIVVTFYGNYKDSHKAAVQKLMKKFDETGMNAPISWLGNRKIEVRFK